MPQKQTKILPTCHTLLYHQILQGYHNRCGGYKNKNGIIHQSLSPQQQGKRRQLWELFDHNNIPIDMTT
jgi:hypothetical protein